MARLGGALERKSRDRLPIRRDRSAGHGGRAGPGSSPSKPSSSTNATIPGSTRSGAHEAGSLPDCRQDGAPWLDQRGRAIEGGAKAASTHLPAAGQPRASQIRKKCFWIAATPGEDGKEFSAATAEEARQKRDDYLVANGKPVPRDKRLAPVTVREFAKEFLANRQALPQGRNAYRLREGLAAAYSAVHRGLRSF